MVIPLRDDNPTARFPIVTILIIVVNVAIYLFVQPHGGTDARLGISREDAFTLEHAAIPCELHQGAPLTVVESNSGRCSGVGKTERTISPGKNIWFAVVASMFLHASLLHLAGNMLFLWIFGNNVEDFLGPIGFLLFYFAMGIAAMGAYYLTSSTSTTAVIGASGAIAGVMGAYLVLWPRARVLTWIPLLLIVVVYLPATVVLAAWFALQLFTSPNEGVAWVAHVGGFGVGVLVALALRAVLGPPPERTRPVA